MGSVSPTLPAQGSGLHFWLIVKRHAGWTIVHSCKACHITDISDQNGLLATLNLKGTAMCNSFVYIKGTAPVSSTTITKENKMAILK